MIERELGAGRATQRKLPIGIQTFREIREDHCYYVDKTAYIGRLVDEGKHYFLSRPRRFGKSLFLDTLKELFEGNDPLFDGLAIHDRWDWSVCHPVLRLDFSRGNFKEPGQLQEDVMAQLDAVERREGVGSDYAGAPARFSHLMEALHERSGQRVAVLVDEYDKPILDALEVPEVARANRDYLRGLYSTIKFGDAHIAFSFLTGVSKFSKVSLFSGLGLYFASVFSRIVSRKGRAYSSILGTIVRVAIVALSLFMGLREMGIANEIITLAFGLILGSAAIAAAMAFGMEGRDLAKKHMEQWTENLKEIDEDDPSSPKEE